MYALIGNTKENDKIFNLRWVHSIQSNNKLFNASSCDASKPIMGILDSIKG